MTNIFGLACLLFYLKLSRGNGLNRLKLRKYQHSIYFILVVTALNKLTT